MVNEFINELMINFSAIVDSSILSELEKSVCMVADNYDIVKKTTEIVVWKRELPKCYEYYMVTKKIEGTSDKTLELYKMYITDMLYTIDKPIEEIGANEIRAYLYNVQKTRGISNRTLNSRRSALSSFFGWISAEGYISKNPMLTVKPIKYEIKERKALKSIDLEKVRNSCETKREKAIIEVFYSTACRVSEMVNLNIEDIDFNTMEVKLFGKGNKHRTSYLSTKALLYLQEYLSERTDNNNALFVSERKPNQRLSKAGIERILHCIGDKAGIDNLFPHLMRHTSATDLLTKGMDVVQLKEFLGHSSLDTSMIYAKVSNNDVKNSHQRYVS